MQEFKPTLAVASSDTAGDACSLLSRDYWEDIMDKSKAALVTLTAILACGGQALASGATWLVTEENSAGIKGAQGRWTVEVDGNKLSGAAEMQADN